jgi:hypothetical protein
LRNSPLSVYKAAVAGSYRFSAAELARLVVYRAAVAAGFYTDQLADDASSKKLGG